MNQATLRRAPLLAAGRAPGRPRAAERGFARRFAVAASGAPGALILGVLVLLAIVWPAVVPFDPTRTSLGQALTAPSSAHWFGTDDLGRDVLSRAVAGTSTSLTVGILSVAFAVLIGVPLGLVAAYVGGWVDNVVMRVMDAGLAFPALVLALAISAAVGPGLLNVAAVIGIVYTPIFARLVRGPCLVIKTREFVDAARVSGASATRTLIRHVLPNTSEVLVVQAALSVGFAIVAEASLSFLGVGIQPSTPSWGGMLKAGYPYLEQAPWISLIPGAFLVTTVLGWMLLGDGVNHALNAGSRSPWTTANRDTQ